MGPFGSRTRYRVKANSWCSRDSGTDFVDYNEARQYYHAALMHSGTGDTVEFYEKGEDGEVRMLIINDDISLPSPSMFSPAPPVDHLEAQRGHKCHWGHDGKCIRCRKSRPFWR